MCVPYGENAFGVKISVFILTFWLRIFLLTIFPEPGMDLPAARDLV